jgi:hypothetical protein
MNLMLKYCLLAGLLAFPGWELAGQTANALQFTHPDAKVLIGVNVRQIRNSAAADAVKKSFTEQFQNVQKTGFPIPGLEFLDDIDTVLISSPGNAPVSAVSAAPSRPRAGSPPVVSRKDPPFVMVIEGTFPASHYQLLLQGQPRTIRGFSVYKPPKSEGFSVAVIDDHTMVIGDDKSLPAALGRRGQAPAESAELLSRAATLASNNDLWIVVSDLSSAVPASPVSPMPGGNTAGGDNAALASQFASQIDAMEIGLSVKDGLSLDVSLAAKSEATVQLLAGLLGSQLQMAAQQPGSPQAAELLKKLNVAAQGKRLSLGVRLSKEEFEQQIRAIQTARMNPRPVPKTDVTIFPPPANRSAQTPPPSGAQTPAPEPQGPRKVRIFGLEGGVKEIPLDNNK